MVKTPWFQCRAPGFNPWSGTISHMLQLTTNKQINKNVKKVLKVFFFFCKFGAALLITECFCFSNMPRILLPHAVNIFLQNTFLHMAVF